MARTTLILLPAILLVASLIGCATTAPEAQTPLGEKFSELESVVDGHGETLRELDTKVGQTNERITHQTISVSQVTQSQRRQGKEMIELTDSQTRLDQGFRSLNQRYHALRVMIVQTQLDEIRARIEFLRKRKRELETQLRDEQDRLPEAGAAGASTSYKQ